MIAGKIAEKLEVPGLSELVEVVSVMSEEAERAEKAETSGTVRDFYTEHVRRVANLKTQLVLKKPDVLTEVQKATDSLDSAAKSAPGKKGKWTAARADDYGYMQMILMDLFVDARARLAQSSQTEMYKMLAEEWIQSTEFKPSGGYKNPSRIVIEVEADYTIRNARIFAPGGQKMAEQLVKDSPSGVDVFGFAVPRTVLYFNGGSGPEAAIRLDENDKPKMTEAPLEGNWKPIYERLIRDGLRPTKAVTGEDEG
jgi:hypothetical protein